MRSENNNNKVYTNYCLPPTYLLLDDDAVFPDTWVRVPSKRPRLTLLAAVRLLRVKLDF